MLLVVSQPNEGLPALKKRSVKVPPVGEPVIVSDHTSVAAVTAAGTSANPDPIRCRPTWSG